MCVRHVQSIIPFESLVLEKVCLWQHNQNTGFLTIVAYYFVAGNVDLSDLLAGMDDQIIKAKEQALSRKDILEKMEKWKFAVEEEAWLEDYERVC